MAQAILGHVRLGESRSDEAVRHYERVANLVPSSFYAGFLGHAYARAGRFEDARDILDDMTAKADRGEYVSPGAIGWILLGLEETDDGYRYLQTAIQQRDVFLTLYGLLASRSLSARFDSDPRFQQLRRSAGMAE